MVNLLVIFSLYRIQCYINDSLIWVAVFVSVQHSEAPWYEIFMLLRRKVEDKLHVVSQTHLHACSKQCVTFRWKHICEVEYMFSKMGFIAMSSPSFSPSRVREPLLFLPPTPHPRRFSRANWKTSVIILVLAQIWWDQRWPAGRRRGADGCMLRGTKQRPFRF